MARIEEFNIDGKDFLHFDLSNLKENGEFSAVLESAKEVIAKYKPNSVYTVTNISNIMYDSETKEEVAKWMSHNKPYVKYGAIYGMDGIKKIMVNAILKICGRSNMSFTNTKEQALEWLKNQ